MSILSTSTVYYGELSMTKLLPRLSGFRFKSGFSYLGGINSRNYA